MALVGISLKMVFLYKFELAKMAPNSVNIHPKNLERTLTFNSVTLKIIQTEPQKYTVEPRHEISNNLKF